MKRGQAAIEFIFLILIVIVYITTVVIPLSKEAQNSISDVEAITRANNEAQKIANTINDVSSMGEGTRQTVTVFLAADTIIHCKDTNISFEVKLKQKPYPAQCQNGICKKFFTFPVGVTLDCRAPDIAARKTNIVIEKLPDKTSFAIGG